MNRNRIIIAAFLAGLSLVMMPACSMNGTWEGQSKVYADDYLLGEIGLSVEIDNLGPYVREVQYDSSRLNASKSQVAHFKRMISMLSLMRLGCSQDDCWPLAGNGKVVSDLGSFDVVVLESKFRDDHCRYRADTRGSIDGRVTIEAVRILDSIHFQATFDSDFGTFRIVGDLKPNI